MTNTDTETLQPILRLSRDLRKIAGSLTPHEARFLVDQYYIMQDNRKRTANQLRALGESGEPHEILEWMNTQDSTLEQQLKRALDMYTDAQPVGQWCKSITGIGPVTTAGLLAHIDIAEAPTYGHIIRYAGLDPSVKWEKGQKRPWNANLKLVCWHIGQGFMKNSNREGAFYGLIYRRSKEWEVARNDRGDNAEKAAEAIKRYSKSTEAYKHLTEGHLPPAQIDARARRYAVKLFISHLHTVWYWLQYSTLPPFPYPIVHQGHAHYIAPPNLDLVEGLETALRRSRPIQTGTDTGHQREYLAEFAMT